ncbi:MAG: hypothetical protein ACHQVS_00560 [Candidatus Babeliales bacterium]
MPCKHGVCSRKSKKSRGGVTVQPQMVNPVATNPQIPQIGQQAGGIQQPNQFTTPSQGKVNKRSGVRSFFAGDPAYSMVTTPYTPDQQNILNWLAQSGQQGLQGLGNQGFDFGPLQQQAQSQFYSETVPTLAERFTAMGGGQRSSAFESAIGRAGAGLKENLAALKAQYDYGNQQNQQANFMNRLQMGLRPQYENAFVPSTGGIFHGAASAVGKAVPLAAGAYFGG